jgi:hypothetical protein
MDGMMEAAAVMRGEVLSSVVLNLQIKICTIRACILLLLLLSLFGDGVLTDLLRYVLKTGG